MKKTSLLFVLLCLCGTIIAQESNKRALFIGNSYTSVNDLPSLVQRIAENTGNTLEIRSNTPGGCTFAQHCENQSMTMIKEGNWDVVVLQEQSQLPSFPQNQVEVECLPFAQRLVDSIYRYNPDAEPMFYMTWGRKNGDTRNAEFFPILGTYEGMDDMLYERYMYMARTNNASVCPVGKVWRYIRTHHPEIELYQSDESHPSQAGSYAAACAFCVMIFHNDPLEITFDYELDSTTARLIREAVHTVVYQILSYWQRGGSGDYPLSIQDAYIPSVSCYPNPTRNMSSIDGDYEIFNLKGQRVTRGTKIINLNNQPNGVYIVKSYQNGKYLGSTKLIKQ